MSDRLPADEVARQDFPLSFRGFDQQEVRAHLGRVAAELTAAREREEQLTARVAELEDAADGEPDEATLERVLGRAAMRVLHAAREAAAEIQANAESSIAEKLAEAESIRASSRDDAERAAGTIRAEAVSHATTLIEDAQRRADGIIADATAERDRLQAELARLRAARDRLAAAFEDVRRSLGADEPTGAADEPGAADAAPEPPRTAPAPAPTHPVMDDAPEPSVVAEPAPPAEGSAELTVVTTPVPSPPASPSIPAADDRRSSSLRLVRTGGTPVAPDDDLESVRIIGPTGRGGAERADDPDDAEGADETEVDVEPDVERADAVDPPAVPETTETEPVATPTPTPAPAPVDDLFNRLRAGRAEKLARASTVLAADETGEPDADDPAAVETEPELEPETQPAEEDDLDPDLAVLAARDEAVADTERGLVRSLKRALADEQNEVLDALRRLRGRPALDALLPDAAVHDARYEAVLGGAAIAAATAGGSGAGGSAVATSLGRTLAGDLRTRVDRAIDEAGDDLETLAEAISATYREWKTARAEPLGREVIAAGYAAGAYEAASGPLRWIVDPAEGGCPDCDDNVLAGPTEKGSPFPTGQLHPPAHAGCRCLAVPAG